MPETNYIYICLDQETISSLNSLHTVIDNSVVTGFLCTECQGPSVEDKVGILVSS